MQETLFPLQACESHVVAHSALRFAVEKLNLRFVPQTLENNRKAERVALSSQLPEVLTSQERNKFDQV
jgi:hypothetical protein